MDFWVLAVTSLLLGVIHAFDSDHVVAVTTFVSQKPGGKNAAGFGLRFGLGHGCTVFVFGVLVMVFKWVITERLITIFEVLAGVSLIVLGFLAIWRGIGLSRDISFKKIFRGHHHFFGGIKHEHDHSHEHDHIHEHDHSHEHDHIHGHIHSHRHGPTVFGMITGLAGTAGVMVFGPVIAAASRLEAALYILLYGLAVAGTMGGYGALLGTVYGWWHRRSAKIIPMVSWMTGIASVVWGLVWIVRII